MKIATDKTIAHHLPSSPTTIVLTGGCFDVLHKAHIEFLTKAKSLGEILIVLLESDENIRALKGNDRPHNELSKRVENLRSLGIIDILIPLSPRVSDKYYYNLTNLIQPDIIAITHGDPHTTKKREQADAVNGKLVELMDRDTRYSSTEVLKEL